MALDPEEKALVDSTRPFIEEDPKRSTLAVVSSVALLAGSTALAARAPAPFWPLATLCSGLLVVRLFVLYHDAMHGALARRNPLLRRLLELVGLLTLTPPRIWAESHNYHHAHTAQLVGSHVGSYPVATVEMWRRMTRRQRFAYAAARHPLTIALGYGTVFLAGMCLVPLLKNPRRYWDSGLALALHVGLSAALWALGGPQLYLRAFLLPLCIAMAVGGYLFYAQHNFPAVHLQPRETWRYTRAALLSSSYMPMGRLMRFFAGNIGYHHVHHLNPLIPYYRLPEAMAALPALQSPGVTRLSPKAVVDCFRLKLWDPDAGRMVPFTGRPRRAVRPPPAASGHSASAPR